MINYTRVNRGWFALSKPFCLNVKVGQLASLVFPRRCFVCQKVGAWLCPSCKKQLPQARLNVCPGCGKASFSGQTHPGCEKNSFLTGLYSPFLYQGAVKSLVISCKFFLIKDLAQLMAQLVVKEIKKTKLLNYWQESQFSLTSLPLHYRRQLWRGFNQSELLVKELENKLNLPWRKNVLSRTKLTKPQAKLSLSERKRKIKGQFMVKKRLKGENLILVDDVYTSGATLKEAAKTLKQSGVSLVWGLTFCR